MIESFRLIFPAFHSEGLIPICPNPFKGFTIRSESFEGLKGVGDQTTVSWSALLHQHPVSIWRCHHHAKNLRKESWGPKCPSVVPFEILNFEEARFENFALEWPFNMAAMIVFTPKCPSEGDIFCLEHTICELHDRFIGRIWFKWTIKTSLLLSWTLKSKLGRLWIMT